MLILLPCVGVLGDRGKRGPVFYPLWGELRPVSLSVRCVGEAVNPQVATLAGGYYVAGLCAGWLAAAKVGCRQPDNPSGVLGGPVVNLCAPSGAGCAAVLAALAGAFALLGGALVDHPARELLPVRRVAAEVDWHLFLYYPARACAWLGLLQVFSWGWICDYGRLRWSFIRRMSRSTCRRRRRRSIVWLPVHERTPSAAPSRMSETSRAVTLLGAGL